LTVGRDRGWRLFERDAAPVEGEGVKEGEEEGERGYSPVGGQGKPHARIIWDCSFSPLFRPAAAGDEEKEDMLFATASRDKTVKVWRRKDRSVSSEHWEAVKTIKFEDGVTSCDFYGGKVDGK
jgi:elongator complex protein 2